MSGTASGALCVADHGVDEDGQPKQASAKVGLLCAGHRRRMDSLASEVQLLILDLAQCIEPGSTPAEHQARKESRKKAAAPPASANVDWIVLMDARSRDLSAAGDGWNTSGDVMPSVPTVLDRWVRQAGLTHVPPRQAVVDRVNLLWKHHDAIAEHPWVVDYLADLRRMRRALKAAVRDQSHRRVGTCDMPTEARADCGGELLAENGTGVVKCNRCNATWSTPQELARLAVRLQ